MVWNSLFGGKRISLAVETGIFLCKRYVIFIVYRGKYMFIPDDARSFDSDTTGTTIGPGTANSSGAP
jgi:hypothetical protein